MVALESHPDIQRQPKITVTIKLRPVRILVIVARRAPAFCDGQILVSNIVTVDIDQFRHLTALHGVVRVVVMKQSEWFMQCRRKLMVCHFVCWLVVHTAQ